MLRSIKSNELMRYSNLLFLILWLNPMLIRSSIVWWGTVFLYLFLFIKCYGGRIKLDKNYTAWTASFAVLCLASILWAVSRNQVADVMKNMIIRLVMLYCIRSQIKNRKDMDEMLWVFLLSCVFNAVYLNVTFQTTKIQTSISVISSRIGNEIWNSNTIGMMMAVASLLVFYFLRKQTSKKKRNFLFIVLVLFVLTAVRSGSRKAILIVAAGSSIYLFLTAKGKRIRTTLLLILGGLTAVYVLMEVPYFYDVIGWRLEGLLAKKTGVGTVDHSTLLRLQLIDNGLRVFRDNFMYGVGIDCVRFLNGSMIGEKLYAHNNYIELLADLGILGTFIYYFGYLFIWKNLLKHLRGNDNLNTLFITIMAILLPVEYGCVTYSDVMFQFLLMLIFTYISITKQESVKTIRGEQ